MESVRPAAEAVQPLDHQRAPLAAVQDLAHANGARDLAEQASGNALRRLVLAAAC